MSGRRPPIAIALVTLVALMAACTVNVPVTTKDKGSPKPKTSPTPTATADVEASTTGTQATPTPKATATPTPKPSPTKTPGAFDEPGLDGSPPPFKYPYNTVGQGWSYAMHVKAGAIPLDGSVDIKVVAVSATDATVATTLAISSALFGSGGKPTASQATIGRNVDNPFSLEALLAGSKDKIDAAASGSAATPTLPPTTSTILKWGHEHIKTDAGEFDTNKYQIQQSAGTDTTMVVLWCDQQTGSMVKEQFDSDKPPNLGASVPIPAGISLGKTTTVLSLKALATPDPNATGAATPTPAATATATPAATGTATPTPAATDAAATS